MIPDPDIPDVQDKEIEDIVREFDEKTDDSKHRTQLLPYHKLDSTEHLLDSEWYPESPYELDKDKIVDWLRTVLHSYGSKEYERGRKEMREEILVALSKSVELTEFGDGSSTGYRRVAKAAIQSLK